MGGGDKHPCLCVFALHSINASPWSTHLHTSTLSRAVPYTSTSQSYFRRARLMTPFFSCVFFRPVNSQY